MPAAVLAAAPVVAPVAVTPAAAVAAIAVAVAAADDVVIAAVAVVAWPTAVAQLPAVEYVHLAPAASSSCESRHHLRRKSVAVAAVNAAQQPDARPHLDVADACAVVAALAAAERQTLRML